MRKVAWTLFVAGAMVASFVAVGRAMSDHWISGGGNESYVACQASIDDMNPELQSPRHWVTVTLYDPQGQWLGTGYDGRSDGSFANATVGVPIIGATGTFRCYAVYHEEWDGGSSWEEDSADYYFDM